MKHLIFKTLVALFAAVSMSSCLDNKEGDNVTRVNYTTNFTRVVDTKTTDAEAYINTGTVYQLTHDLATNKFALVVANFKPASTSPTYQFEVKDLR